MRPAASGTPPTGRVVIADDDAAIRGLMIAAVQKAGALVVASVGDGASAMAAVRDHPTDLLLLDVSMPGLSGLDVCRRIRRTPAGVGLIIVLLSAAVHAAAVEAGLEAGADLYLEKPFSPRALAAQLRELLTERSRAGR